MLQSYSRPVCLEVRKHPILEGVFVREDGYVFVPKNRARKAHWTFGTKTSEGYCHVKIAGVDYAVHNLVARTYLGVRPEGAVIDHINRCRHSNDYRNLRYTTLSGNRLNCKQCDDALEKYGFHPGHDRKEYRKQRLVLDATAAEKQKESQLRYRNKNRALLSKKAADYNRRQREKGLVHRKNADGKYCWVPKEATTCL